MSLLTAIGKILEVDDSVMALSVLAIGNSLEDMINNVAVAKAGNCICSVIYIVYMIFF